MMTMTPTQATAERPAVGWLEEPLICCLFAVVGLPGLGRREGREGGGLGSWRSVAKLAQRRESGLDAADAVESVRCGGRCWRCRDVELSFEVWC